MKKIFLILIIFGYAFLDIVAQLTVKIENGKEKELVGLSRIHTKDGRMILSVIKDGKADLSIDISQKTLLVLGCQDEVYFLFGEPGQEYILDCSTKKIQGGDKKIRFFLDEWSENYFNIPGNTLTDHMRFLTGQNMTTNVAKRTPLDEKIFLEPDFLNNMHKWQKGQEKALKKFKTKDKDFYGVFSDFLYTSYWERLIRTTDLIRFEGHDVPENLLDEVLKMEVDKPGFTEKSYAGLWLTNYINAMEDKGLIKPTLNDYVLKTASSLKTPELKEFYVLNELEKKVVYSDLVYFEELFSSAAPCVVTAEGKKKYERIFAKGKFALAKQSKFDGVKAKELNFVTMDGKEVALSDYAGKYVYIDLWATWCGPCKQETPHFLKLAERMQGKNIVFISLSVDDKRNEQAWKKYVNEHKLQEYCIAGWTGNGLKGAFTSYYGISSIPRFMLVGPDGNMIYNDCWRPSSVQIDELLNSFLN